MQPGEAWSAWTRYPWGAGAAPDLGSSCACGGLSTSQTQHIAQSLSKLGGNAWGDKADSRKLRGRESSRRACRRELSGPDAPPGEESLWAPAHLCAPDPRSPSYAHNSHISLKVGPCHLFQEAFPDPQSGLQGPSVGCLYFLLVSVLGPFRAETIGMRHCSDLL